MLGSGGRCSASHRAGVQSLQDAIDAARRSGARMQMVGPSLSLARALYADGRPDDAERTLHESAGTLAPTTLPLLLENARSLLEQWRRPDIRTAS